MLTRRAVLVLFGAAVLVSATAADARPRRRGRDEMHRLIRNCEQRTNDFRGQIDRALDHSRLDGTRREWRLNSLARRLENEMDTVRHEFERRDDFMDIRENVERALDAAREIDRAMEREHLERDAERAWRRLRADLDRLADRFDMRGLR
jgi:hypothetical protein